MRTIDERIVEMQFDNKQFERNAQASLNTIERLKKSLQFKKEARSFEEIERASKQVSLDRLSMNVDSVAQRFSTFGIIGVTALQNISNSVVNLGRQMIRSLTVAPLSQGYAEYELKMGSIQTIMMSTGASLKDVNGYLDELNTYADKTIYSFADMTSNIGKFTNAGVNLKDSVLAIQGVSNVAAVSGANANEASRAMYNFAQALSAGYVKLIDWKSIEVANMATVEFKTQLLEAAVAAGTLTRTEDGMYKTLKGSVLDATHNFNDTLQEQWMTTDVLVNTLRDYADETTEIGAKAFAAAQDVKTFTQLMDTLKEAAGSGWAMTWEILFGNFEEAKELWTSLSKSVGGFIDNMSSARNELLQRWKNLGGRADVLSAFKNSLNAVYSVLKPIKDAFDEIFPDVTAWRLWQLTHSLKEFTESLKISDEASDNLKRTFKGLFAILDIGRQAFSALFGGVANFAEKTFSTVGTFLGLTDKANGGLLGFTATIGDFFVSLDKTISETGIFTGAMDTIWKVLEPIVDGIQHIIASIANALSGFKGLDTNAPEEFANSLSEHFSVFSVIGDILRVAVNTITAGLDKIIQLFSVAAVKLSDAWNAIMSAISNSGDTAAFDIFNAGLMGILISGLKKFMNSLENITENVGGFLGSIKDILGGVKDVLGAYQKELQAKTLINIAIAIGILAASLAVLASIDAERLASALVGMSVLFYELFGALSSYQKIMGPTGIGKGVSSVLFFIGLASAMLILASAVKKLSSLGWGDLAKGLASVAVMSKTLIKSVNGLNLESKGLVKTAVSFVIFGAAMNVMASAVKKLGGLNIDQLIKGLVSVAVIMNEVSMFAGQVNGTKIMSTAAAMVLIGSAMVIFGVAIDKIGSLPLDSIGKGLVGIGGSLLMLSEFIKLVSGSSNSIIGVSIGLIGISAAMVILAKAIEDLGGMSWESLAKGFFTMAGSLLVMKAAVQGLETALPGAAAMLVMSGAVLTLAGAFHVIEKMSWEGIAKSFVVLAGAFAVFGAASVILAPVVPVMLSLGAAVALVGVGVGAIGAGVLAFAAGLAALSAAGVGASAAIVTLGGAIASLIPMILTQLGNGIVAAAGVITKGAPAIAEAFMAILSAIFVLIVEGAPKLAEGVAILLETLLTTIDAHLPNFISSGWNILKGFLSGVRDHISETASLAVDIASEFIVSLGEQAPRLVEAGIDFIVKFIDGVADAIEDGIPEIMAAIGGLVRSIASGIKNGLLSFGSSLFGSGENMGDQVISGVESSMDINSPSKKMAELGRYAALGLSNGIENNTKSVTNAGKDLGKNLLDSLQGALKIKSPSRLMRDEVGRWVAEGIAEGITDSMSPEEAAEKKAQNIVNAFKTEFNKLDLNDTTSNLEYKLWAAMNPNANAAQLATKQNELMAAQLVSQSERVALAQDRYSQSINEFGQDAKQTQEAYNEYLQQQISLIEITQSITEAQQAQNESVASAQVAYAKWMTESKDDLLKIGYSLEEIEAAARKATGWDPEKLTQTMSVDAAQATTTAMTSVKTAFSNSAEQVFSGLTMSFSDYGTTYGGAIGDGFVKTFGESQARINKALDELEAQLNERISELKRRFSSILSSDTEEKYTITPVLDLSEVKSGASEINGLLGAQKTMKIAQKARQIMTSLPLVGASQMAKVENVVNNYNFEQNNYSPEALSRQEIYRQTNNQISQMKQRSGM